MDGWRDGRMDVCQMEAKHFRTSFKSDLFPAARKHVGSRSIFPVAGLCVSFAFRAPLQTEEEAQKKDNASIGGCFKSRSAER